MEHHPVTLVRKQILPIHRKQSPDCTTLDCSINTSLCNPAARVPTCTVLPPADAILQKTNRVARRVLRPLGYKVLEVQGLNPATVSPAAARAALQAELTPQQQAAVDAETERLFKEVSEGGGGVGWSVWCEDETGVADSGRHTFTNNCSDAVAFNSWQSRAWMKAAARHVV